MSPYRQNTNLLINLVFFQAVWFLTILAAASGIWWPGFAGLAIFVAVHYFVSPTARADFLLAICAVFIGLVGETVFVQTGLRLDPAAGPTVAGIPVWILALWMSFALTMNGCLNWLHGRYILAALLGFLGGPLSYFGGIKLGAATAGDSPETALLVVAFFYAMITPLLLYLAQRLAGLRSA
jgi:hypothetical protein